MLTNTEETPQPFTLKTSREKWQCAAFVTLDVLISMATKLAFMAIYISVFSNTFFVRPPF